MIYTDIIRSAFRALATNITRTLLTTLGIMIGIAAVITMMEIGKGSSSALRDSIENMGANNFVVFPSSVKRQGIKQSAGSNVSLSPDDYNAIVSECKNLLAAAPIVNSGGQVVYKDKNCAPERIVGSNPDYLVVKGWTQFEAGQMFTENDVNQVSQVCVIGTTVAHDLFENESPLGKEIRVRGITVRVLGVLKSKGANMFGQDQDDLVVIPWTTLRYRISGDRYMGGGSSSMGTSGVATDAPYPSTGPALYAEPDATQIADARYAPRLTSLSSIMVTAKSNDKLQMAQDEIKKLLKMRHKIAAGMESDFAIFSFGEMAENLKSTTRIMTNLLLCVAMISLIVGGVGIMNIMLVSVTERTREIGLRMAIGAKSKDILSQFLLESMVLCLTGGIIGIAFGLGGAQLVNYFLKWPIESSTLTIVVAVFISGSVGVVFGFYPAWKAAKLDPIEALRYE